MSEKEIRIVYQQYKDASDLEEHVQDCVAECIDLAKNAYAPYSKFHVSSLALLENGQKVGGTNVENASYPVSICAERNVLSTVISTYPKLAILELFIHADVDSSRAVPPCGLCRQSLVEAERRQNKKIRLYLIGKDGQITVLDSATDLLPLHFDGSFLQQN